MEKKYPQILIPKEIYSIKRKNPPIPPEPLKPIYPQKKVPIRPKEPDKPFGFGTAFLIFVVLIGVGIGLALVVPLFGILLFGFAIFLVFSWSKNWSTIHNKYNEDYRKYLKDIENFKYLKLNYESLYNNELNNYNNILLPQYNVSHSIYLNKKQELETKLSITKYRKEQISEYFSKAIKPQKIKNEFIYSKGVTEKFFLNYLQEYFRDNVSTGLSVQDPKFIGNPYLPDYVISIPTINLYVDVEIDEPYIGHDGTPIHYLNGCDNYRNEFFLNKRWIIIRFAEIQVVKFPEKCCELINSTIDWITTKEKDISTIKDQVEGYNCWTKEEAHRLAFTRFRNKYLPQKLSENLDSEIMELERKFLNLNS